MKQRLAVLAAAAIWSAAAPASAQVIRTRPFPGLFGSGDPAKSVTQVDFLSFVSGGYETETPSFDGRTIESSATDRSFGNLVFSGRVAHQGRRTMFGGSASATTDYYGGGTGLRPFNLSAETHFSGALGRHSTFSLRQTVFYSPYYVFAAAADVGDGPPDGEAVTDPDAGSFDPRSDERVFRLSTKGYTSDASLGRRAGRDGLFYASYALRYIDYEPGVYDLIAHAPRAGYRHRISRFASLNASYGVQIYEYRRSPFDRLMSQNVGLGIGYDRPLSAWRRTTVGFDVSTALVGEGALTRFHVNGNARLHRRFGRTWITGLTYRRGQQVLEGFAVPFFAFSDSIRGTFGGRLARDIALSGRATYAHSRYTLGALRNEFDTMSASARVQVPVMWALAFYVEGYYTDHAFQRRLGLLEGVPLSLERFGTRVGLTVSVPLYR